MAMALFLKVLAVTSIPLPLCSGFVDPLLLSNRLSRVLLDHKIKASRLYHQSLELSETSLYNQPDFGPRFRTRRDMPSIHMRKGNKKLRTCQNMNGILGGENAFNYVAFVVAVLTLVVNVNNNINNNNNNLNQFNLNTADNNNANSNTNNNNGNIVNVMPPGKKKKKRRSLTSHPKNSTISTARPGCQELVQNDVAQAALASVLLIQGFLKSIDSESEDCQLSYLCKSFQSIERLGETAAALSRVSRLVSSFFLVKREVGITKTFDALLANGSECINCKADLNRSQFSLNPGDLKCSQCFHSLVSGKVRFKTDLPINHAKSEIVSEDLLGQKNVTVLEFENPHHFRFLTVQLDELNVIGQGDWNGDDPWFKGFSWKIAKCPVCGQPIGWMWEPTEYLDENYERPTPGSGFYSLRLDKILDVGNSFIGPSTAVPDIVRSFIKYLFD